MHTSSKAPVILAKAGIHDDKRNPVRRMDSRFRGNDGDFFYLCAYASPLKAGVAKVPCGSILSFFSTLFTLDRLCGSLRRFLRILRSDFHRPSLYVHKLNIA
jgi:hypothetical protein